MACDSVRVAVWSTCQVKSVVACRGLHLTTSVDTAGWVALVSARCARDTRQAWRCMVAHYSEAERHTFVSLEHSSRDLLEAGGT